MVNSISSVFILLPLENNTNFQNTVIRSDISLLALGEIKTDNIPFLGRLIPVQSSTA